MARYKGILFLLGGLVFGVGLGALILFSGQIGGNSNNRKLPPTVGSSVPSFELQQLGGELQSLNGYQGKPLVINFWATWCPPCKEEMPLLNRYAEQYAGRVAFVGIDYDEKEAVVQKFVEDNNIGFPILLDPGGLVSNLYYVHNYPTTFFIDEAGVLRAQHIGILSESLLERYMKTIGLEP